MSKQEYTRPQAAELLRRLGERRRFMQVVTGARQVGKTTLVTQVVERARLPYVVASADEPTLRGPEWLDAQWEAARLLLRDTGQGGALLVLDEVQKVPHWSEAVKRLWDADTRARRPLKVGLLGSPPLLVQRGLTESLAGRFRVGPLQDAGNTTTLAHYLELLAGAGMLIGLQKYAAAAVRQRGSSPKLQVLNTALMTAPSGMALSEARRDREFWGRLVESAVGAHLANAAAAGDCEVFYWRDRNAQGDFVLRAGKSVTALEVQSGRARHRV